MGLVYTLDLGVRSGFAKGAPGERPASGAVVLKKPGEPQDVAFANLIDFLNVEWSDDRPALVVKEAPFSLQAFLENHGSQNAVLMTYGLHAIVRGVAGRFGVPCEDAYAATVRKHFLGKGRLGTRKETKAAIVDRCHLLKLLPADVKDDNRADAIATFDYVCATRFGRAASIRDFHLFGETAA